MGSEGKKTLNPGIASNFQNEYSKQAQLAIDNDDEQFFQFMKAFFCIKLYAKSRIY